MSFLKWLFKDSEPSEQSVRNLPLVNELRSIQQTAEDQALKEAQEWYKNTKAEIIEHCLKECKSAAAKRRNSEYILFNASHRGYDFTDDIIKELQSRGLSVRVSGPGSLDVSW